MAEAQLAQRRLHLALARAGTAAAICGRRLAAEDHDQARGARRQRGAGEGQRQIQIDLPQLRRWRAARALRRAEAAEGVVARACP